MSTFTDDLAALKAVATSDLFKLDAPPLLAFLQSVAANPTAINIAAQEIQLVAALTGSIPTIGQDLLKEMATLLSSAITTLTPTLTNTKGA